MRIAKAKYGVARVVMHTKSTIEKYERHNERKNEHYGNMSVKLSRIPMNIHFKDCDGLTYNEYLNKLVADGTTSLRELKQDAKAYDEVISMSTPITLRPTVTVNTPNGFTKKPTVPFCSQVIR